jgi:hypothetical protein
MKGTSTKIAVEMTPEEALRLDTELGWLLNLVPDDKRDHFISNNGHAFNEFVGELNRLLREAGFK